MQKRPIILSIPLTLALAPDMCAAPQNSPPNVLLAGDTPNTWNPYSCLVLISSMHASASLVCISRSELQCVAVCCSVLQCVAECCSVLQVLSASLLCFSSLPLQLFPLCLCMPFLHVMSACACHVCLSMSCLRDLFHACLTPSSLHTRRCSVLQCVAVCCSVLQCDIHRIFPASFRVSSHVSCVQLFVRVRACVCMCVRACVCPTWKCRYT